MLRLKINTNKVKNLFAIWGGISLTGIILFAGYFFYSLTFGNKTIEDKATKSDVRFVLNWSGLGEQRIEKVIHSYKSARSLTGDYLDAYAIKITNVANKELTVENGWYRLDSLPVPVNDAVNFAYQFFQNEISWFPELQYLKKKKAYVYPAYIRYHGTGVYATQLIFAIPTEKMVYYVGVKV